MPSRQEAMNELTETLGKVKAQFADPDKPKDTSSVCGKMRTEQEIRARLAAKQAEYTERMLTYSAESTSEHEMSFGGLEDRQDEADEIAKLDAEIDQLRWVLGEIE